jgi:hypothetical protein
MDQKTPGKPDESNSRPANETKARRISYRGEDRFARAVHPITPVSVALAERLDIQNATTYLGAFAPLTVSGSRGAAAYIC